MAFRTLTFPVTIEGSTTGGVTRHGILFLYTSKFTAIIMTDFAGFIGVNTVDPGSTCGTFRAFTAEKHDCHTNNEGWNEI